jgi:hypothetical protein
MPRYPRLSNDMVILPCRQTTLPGLACWAIVMMIQGSKLLVVYWSRIS